MSPCIRGDTRPPGVYIAVPFCRQKCTYCNFNSGVFPTAMVEPYLAAVRKEISSAVFTTPPDTLYLGGGTPSLLSSRQLCGLLNALPARNWREATLEASPGDITPDKAAAWASAGINRVSIGVQSFVPREARAAGRLHTPETVEAEIDILVRAGISNFNVDLIAGLAHQNQESWEESLDWAGKLRPRHVSVYMLETGDDSRLGAEIRSGGRRYGAQDTPSEDEAADLYTSAISALLQMAYSQYEISNFCQLGFESVHNLKYWTMTPYHGFGADAHSFDGHTRWWNASDPSSYIDQIQKRRGPAGTVEIGWKRHLEDKLLTGLRLRAGVLLESQELAEMWTAVNEFIGAQLIEFRDGRLRLTGRGLMISNEVFERLLLDSPSDARHVA